MNSLIHSRRSPTHGGEMNGTHREAKEKKIRSGRRWRKKKKHNEEESKYTQVKKKKTLTKKLSSESDILSSPSTIFFIPQVTQQLFFFLQNTSIRLRIYGVMTTTFGTRR